MKRRFLGQFAVLVASTALFAGLPAQAQAPAPAAAPAAGEAPDALIQRLSNEMLGQIKADASLKAGDVNKVIQLVDAKVMPHVNFTRMAAAAVGPQWRSATPDQQKRLQEEFKLLMVRTYSGALAQVNDQTITVKPLRAAAGADDVVVRTEVRGRGDPIQLDYRMEKTASGWKVYNLNVLGVWLVENYRNQFAAEINAKGIDGLIASLADRNKANAAAKKS